MGHLKSADLREKCTSGRAAGRVCAARKRGRRESLVGVGYCARRGDWRRVLVLPREGERAQMHPLPGRVRRVRKAAVGVVAAGLEARWWCRWLWRRRSKGDLPVYYNGLGTVTAFNTVTVRSRVDGQIVKINFTEGQMVHQGDSLVEIDPAPISGAVGAGGRAAGEGSGAVARRAGRLSALSVAVQGRRDSRSSRWTRSRRRWGSSRERSRPIRRWWTTRNCS